jgi:hypothetical protein
MNSVKPALVDEERVSSRAAVAAALAGTFRGKFCDLLLPNRKVISFAKNTVMYDVGNSDRTLFFLQSGFVKIGTLRPLAPK